MRACKSLKRSKQEELKERVRCLEKDVVKLEEVVRELQHRITQLEIARKIGF